MNPNKIVFDQMIANGAKVGSKVKVVQKSTPENIIWRDEMNKWVGEIANVNSIADYCNGFLLELKEEYWTFPASALELIQDEMPFEGEIPDGWELWLSGDKVERLVHADASSLKAWVMFKDNKTGSIWSFSDLTLKPKA